MRNLCPFLLPVFSQLTWWRSQSKTLKFTGHDCSVWQRNISEFMAMAGKKSSELQLQSCSYYNPHFPQFDRSFTAFSTQLCLFKSSTASRRKLIPRTVNLGRKAEIAWFGCHPLKLWNRSFLWSSKLYGIYTSRNVWTFMHSLVLRQAHVIDRKVRRKNTIKYPHES